MWKKCIQTGKAMFTKKQAREHKRKNKEINKFYLCEYCNMYHTSKVRNKLDKMMYDGNNEIGAKLINKITNDESKPVSRVSKYKSYHTIWLNNTRYLVLYNKRDKTCKFREAQ